MRRALPSQSTGVATIWLAILILWIVIAPRPHLDLERILEVPKLLGNPAASAFLGADAFGRELVPTLAEAMKRSLIFALATSGGAAAFGICVGAAIGMTRGRRRFWSERGLEFFLAFPPMLLALGVQAAIGTGWRALSFAVVFGLFPVVVRFVSTRAKEIAVSDYVLAAHALGGSDLEIFWRHYRPALLAHLRLKFPSLLSQALLLEATLSFLNLGVPPGVLSWGSLLTQGKDYLIEAPHIAWIVGAPLVLTLWSLQRWADRAIKD